jgi:DNA-binding CsgD family transcriptional regulator
MAKKKLKTMNEISAAEAVILFHAAMSFDSFEEGDVFQPNPRGFPKDIAAKDFMESLVSYRDMWRVCYEEEAADSTPFYYDMSANEIATLEGAPIVEKDLQVEEALKKVPAKERALLELIHRQPELLVKQIADMLKKSEGAVKVQLQSLFRRFEVHRRAELIAKTRPFFPPA